MRAKLPAERMRSRDGVKHALRGLRLGDETMLFVPPWSIVHSRVYKAQLPWFSERFRCIAYDCRGNGKSDRPADRGGLCTRIYRRCARGHGRDQAGKAIVSACP